MKLPHHMSLSISHNPNKNYYQTVSEYLEDDLSGLDRDAFESESAVARAVETDELWSMQITPVGSFILAAPSLSELLSFAERVVADN